MSAVECYNRLMIVANDLGKGWRIGTAENDVYILRKGSYPGAIVDELTFHVSE